MEVPSMSGILSIQFFLLLIWLILSEYFVAGSDKVRLRDIEVLTLYQGRMTKGRRSTPIPQLTCTGGSAGCSAFIPEVIQCYNRGWDGYDAQWECKTDMDYKYRFGKIQVNCEGYDYPDDPYILRGSCGLQYSIELTDKGYARKRSSNNQGWRNYERGSRTRYSSIGSSGFGDLFMFVFVALIFFMLFKTCVSNRNNLDNETMSHPYNPDPNYRGTQGSNGPPPPYSADPPGFKREHARGTERTAGSGTSTESSGYPGFWTGAAAGGLLGYLFGGGSRTNYYQNPYNSAWGNGWRGQPYYDTPSYHNTGHYGNIGGFFGNWFGGSGSYRPSHSSYGFSSFDSSSSRSRSSSPSSGSRTASGMGGTSRR
ncbi:store-operated calcium entry-associated regulatory factor-like [Xenia sp. Carnegie-2017]|uniref:store-operated calcium entry-associated regulatory factor-like n=1 Tax=Xenia sp. Carnegie-2017 TaxID=2897299 RepID=UPI001F042C9D|nr:store-operated calcium entry-associated regulatory factor-like [Xenia sp. Carnegie-2017]